MLVVGIAQRHVLDFLGQLAAFLEIELDEFLDLGLVHRLGADVDEDRTRQRLIFAGHHGVDRRCHRLALGIDDLHGLQLALVLVVIGETEEAQRIVVARDALHQHVVVFRGGEIAAAGLGFAVDGFGEVVEGAGIGAGAEELERRIGPGRIDVLPLHDLALGGRLPHLLEFGHGQLIDERVLRVHHHGQGVESHRQLDILDAGLGAVFHFLLQDGARRVGNVGLTAAELLEAAAGTGNPHGNSDATLLGFLEVLGNRLGDGKHGRGAVDLDQRLGMNSGGGKHTGDDGGNFQGLHGQTPLCVAVGDSAV